MIISKKRLDEIVDKAVSDAIKENNAYREKMDYERYVAGRFDSINQRMESMASDIYKDVNSLRNDTCDEIEALQNKINELECRISHKKKK